MTVYYMGIRPCCVHQSIALKLSINSVKLQPMNTNRKTERKVSMNLQGSRSFNSPNTPNRSVSKKPSPNRFKGGSKFTSEMCQLQQQLQNSNKKLFSCLQIYSLLENNMQGQRCLQHNNSLSLYCLTERRILCVNCIFGLHRHRKHKIVPLKDCMNLVYEDIDQLKELMEQQLKKLDQCDKTAEENEKIMQRQLENCLEELQKEHQKTLEGLNNKYNTLKQTLRNSYEPIIDQCARVRKELMNFKYHVFETYSKYNAEMKISHDDNREIMRQILYVNILEMCDVKFPSISKNQIRALNRRGKASNAST